MGSRKLVKVVLGDVVILFWKEDWKVGQGKMGIYNNFLTRF